MQADDLSVALSDEVFHNGALWSDGWYLYQGTGLSGPFTVEEIFKAESSAPLSAKAEAAWLSRKGLSRWYQFASLQHAFQGKPLLLEQTTPLPLEHKRSPLLIGKQLGFKKDTDEEDLNIVSSTLAKPGAKSLEYYYLISRGRLRLGSKETPWVQAFVKPLLSLGLSLKAWYEQAMIEATYHLDDPQASERLRGFWYILVPGWHLVLLYRLGKLILQMEVQNRYRKTSPFLALFLGLFPPLAVIYLQRALNRHWDLHVRYLLRK